MKKNLKIGHRGAKGYEAENTLASFQSAIEMRVDGVELDVHLSQDGVLFVIHDETVDRTTNGKGVVQELNLLELKSFRTKNEEQIPTLSEVLDLINQNCFVNIELKGQRTAKPVVELIQNYVLAKKWNYNKFLVSSFDWIALKEVRTLNSEIPIGVLTHTDLDLAIAFAQFIKAETIHPYFHLLTPENTKQMQKEGFQVLTWTVNEPKDIQQIQSLQVDGIISDFPDKL